MIKHLASAAWGLFALGCGSALVGEPSGNGRPRAENTLTVATSDWNPSFVDVRGQAQRPFDDSEVRALALIFALPDCPIANSYIPTINRLTAAYQPRGIRWVLVQADPHITEEKARSHADQYEVLAPVVMDPQHIWVKRAGATRTPEVAVFSRLGQVLYRGRIDDQYVGLGKRRMEATLRDLADALDAILAGKPVPRQTTEAVGCYIPDLPKGK